MVKQYVGARYVPKFANPIEWAADTSYEALTIVTFNNASYTSKIQVPPTVGNPANNPKYWALTGNYNAQVEQYRRETENYNAQAEQYRQETENYNAQAEQYRQETENYNAQVNQYRKETENYNAQVEQYRQETEAIGNNLNNLSAQISQLNKNKKIIMIGDSYGVQNDGSVTTFFWEYFRDALGLTDGTNFFHRFQSGAGFGNEEYLSQLQTISNSITDKDSITDIFVCGGWNDSDKSQSYGTDEAFNNGVNHFKTYIDANYPKARMTLAHISWGNPQNKPAVYSQMKVSIQRYSEQSLKGWRILSGTEHILHRYDENIWQSDYAHPSQLGQNYLGIYLPSAFLSGSCDINYFGVEHTVVTANTDFTIVGDYKTYESLNGNQYNLDYPWQTTMHSSAGVTIRTDTSQQITAFGSDFTLGLVKENSTCIAVPCRLYADNKWYNGSANVTLKNNLVTFGINVIDQNMTPSTLTVNYIIMPPLHFSIPFINC